MFLCGIYSFAGKAEKSFGRGRVSSWNPLVAAGTDIFVFLDATGCSATVALTFQAQLFVF